MYEEQSHAYFQIPGQRRDISLVRVKSNTSHRLNRPTQVLQILEQGSSSSCTLLADLCAFCTHKWLGILQLPNFSSPSPSVSSLTRTGTRNTRNNSGRALTVSTWDPWYHRRHSRGVSTFGVITLAYSQLSRRYSPNFPS